MPEHAPETRTYRYPPRTVVSWTGAALFSAAVCIAAVTFQFTRRPDLLARGQLLIFTAAFGALALHAFTAVRIVSRRVVLRTDGIQHGGSVVPWSRIAAIDTQPLLQRLDVFDDGGHRVLVLRPELEAFPAVRSYIIEHMSPRPRPLPTEVPLLSPVRWVVPAVALGLLAVWFGPRQSGVLAVLAGGFALALAALYPLRRRSLRLERGALVLREGLRTVRVPYREITGVRTVVERQGRGEVHAVLVERDRAGAIGLSGFRGGYRAAAVQIEHAWREGTRS